MLIILRHDCDINGKNLVQLRNDERISVDGEWVYVIRHAGELVSSNSKQEPKPLEETVLMIPNRNILAIAKNE